MNEEFFDNQEYYLVDTFNGITKKSKIKFSVVNNSKYNLKNTKEVNIESKTKKIDSLTGEEYYAPSVYEAFMKSSKEKYSDDLDIINSEIADLLDISSSKVYRVETNTDSIGIVNISVKDQSEQQIGLDILVNKIVKLIKTKQVTLTPWLKSYFSLPIGDSAYLLTDEKDIITVIEMSYNTITTLFKLNDEQKKTLKTDYIKMIYFDLISNNSNRSFNTYSIIVNNDMSFKKFSPVYDYNNSLVNNDYYLLNNVYIDKSAILSTLYHEYYDSIKMTSRGLRDNYGLYIESINLIIDNNIDELNANIIKGFYKANIDAIKSLENIHSNDFNENRLDIAMTQTSINLNALNKNQMVHSKYRKIKKEESVKVEKQEDIKIKVEKDTEEKSSNLFNIIMIILALTFLAGIIAGIIYIIMHFR